MSVHIELATVREQAERLAVLEPLVPILVELVRLKDERAVLAKEERWCRNVADTATNSDIRRGGPFADYLKRRGKLMNNLIENAAAEKSAWESARAALRRLNGE